MRKTFRACPLRHCLPLWIFSFIAFGHRYPSLLLALEWHPRTVCTTQGHTRDTARVAQVPLKQFRPPPRPSSPSVLRARSWSRVVRCRATLRVTVTPHGLEHKQIQVTTPQGHPHHKVSRPWRSVSGSLGIPRVARHRSPLNQKHGFLDCRQLRDVSHCYVSGGASSLHITACHSPHHTTAHTTQHNTHHTTQHNTSTTPR